MNDKTARVLRFPLVRIILAILAVAAPFALVSTALNLFVTDKFLRRLGALLLAAIVLVAYRAYVRLVEKRAVTELSRHHAMRELAAGLALGALLLSVSIGILAALGVYQVTGNNGWRAMLAILYGAILSGVLEEVVVRGVIFRIVEQSLGSWISLAISALLFGAAHLANHGATLLNAGAISIEAGVLLAAAYMVTRRLWFCIGIHIAWNFTQGGIFSGAVSGGVSHGLLQAKLVGPEWLTGGEFGVEASVVAFAVCTIAGVLLLAIALRKGEIIRPFWSRDSAQARGEIK
ncbi:MAG TPA: CPBP family intramembrane glutamic endopeptidase [Steroidobacteraceae bacterium]